MDVKQPFEAEVLDHGHRVLRICRSILASIHADDAWSAMFLFALKAYRHLLEDANVKAWVVTIAHLKAVGIIRIRSRQIPAHTVPELTDVPNPDCQGN